MKYIFGPVNSRRLGVSLGVDLVPYKTCTLNCVYCECGLTDCLTDDIREWVPASTVLDELAAFMAGKPEIDVITFSGSGEPTLHSGIGEIISEIKNRYGYPVAVLTNGTLLNRPEVRSRLMAADTVIPTLNAVTAESFNKIVRPVAGVTAESLISGIKEFSREYSGRLIIELFIIPGINDSDNELSLLKGALSEIGPDLIQINTLDRPGTEDWITVPGPEELNRIKKLLHPLNVAVVGKAAGQAGPQRSAPEPDLKASIIDLVTRRPSTIDDIVSAVESDRERVFAAVEKLLREGELVKSPGPRGDFYSKRERVSS